VLGGWEVTTAVWVEDAVVEPLPLVAVTASRIVYPVSLLVTP
jgi:hypothetical protein